MERGSGAIVRCINNAGGTRFRALYCRSALGRCTYRHGHPSCRISRACARHIRLRDISRHDDKGDDDDDQDDGAGSGSKAPRITCR